MKGEKKKLLVQNNAIVEMDINQAYEKFRRLGYKQIKSWIGKYERDDLIQIADIGLIKTFNNYDINKGNQFATLLIAIVNNEIYAYNRRNLKHENIERLDNPIAMVDGNTVTILDTVEDEINYEDLCIKNIELSMLHNKISKLPYRYRKIIELTLKGKSQLEIGGLLGISQSYTSRLQKQAYDKLNELYGNDTKVIRKKRNTKEIQITKQQFERAARNGVNKNTVYARVHQCNWDIEKAINTPIDRDKSSFAM